MCGGGDGVRALNDVFILDIANIERLTWSKLESTGRPPISRGYHTSNLVGDKLVVYGGSDGHECFNDVHVLDLGEYLVEDKVARRGIELGGLVG